jgi:hypothetical protein
MASVAEQQASERRSLAGFINAEISAFVFMARLNAEKYALGLNNYDNTLPG